MATTPYFPLVPGVLIDPANDSTQLGAFGNLFSGAFVFAGTLYAVLFGQNALFGTVQIANSTDDGATWTLLDSAHAPGAANSGAWTQQGSSLVVGTQANSGDALDFVTFDLTTGLWSTSTVATSPVISALGGLVARTDGSLVLIANNGNSGADSGFDVYIWNGAAWSAGIDLGAGLIAQSWYAGTFGTQNPTYCTDGDTIWFANTAVDGGGFQIVFAVALSAADAVENLFVFPANSGSMPPAFPSGSSNANGWPCLVGTTIILPLYVAGQAGPPSVPDYPTLAASFDGGVTWAILGTPGIDPAAFAGLSFPFAMAHYAAQATSDGTNLYLVYGLLDGSSNATKLRLCVTTPTGTNPATWTWTNSTAQNITSLGVNFSEWESPFLLWVSGLPSLLLAASALDITTFATPMLFLTSFIPTAGGRVLGTFVGFVVGGQFSGGTK